MPEDIATRSGPAAGSTRTVIGQAAVLLVGMRSPKALLTLVIRALLFLTMTSKRPKAALWSPFAHSSAACWLDCDKVGLLAAHHAGSIPGGAGMNPIASPIRCSPAGPQLGGPRSACTDPSSRQCPCSEAPRCRRSTSQPGPWPPCSPPALVQPMNAVRHPNGVDKHQNITYPRCSKYAETPTCAGKRVPGAGQRRRRAGWWGASVGSRKSCCPASCRTS